MATQQQQTLEDGLKPVVGTTTKTASGTGTTALPPPPNITAGGMTTVPPAALPTPGTVPTTQQQTSQQMMDYTSSAAQNPTLQAKAAAPAPTAVAAPKPATEGTRTLPPPPNLHPTALGQMPVLTQLPAQGGASAPPATGTLPAPGMTSMTPITASQNLLGTQIAPGQGVDRFKMAEDRFNQFTEATNPQYEAMIRRATQKAAANGRLGSGMLTTEYGNLAGDRAREMDLQKRGFLSQALEGTIGDARSDRQELRGERDYQFGLDRTALEDSIRQLLLGEQLQTSDLNQQLALSGAQGSLGFSNNPWNTMLSGSGQHNQNAGDMYALIAQLLGGAGYQQAQG